MSSPACEAAANSNAPLLDLFVLDAFSSDAIPLHLVTHEAMAVYLSRLAPDGMIMFHLSNRHINLRPVLPDLAADASIAAYVQRNYAKGREKFHYGSSWVVMARTVKDLALILVLAPKASPWRPLKAKAGRRVLTDDYGNLIIITRAWLR